MTEALMIQPVSCRHFDGLVIFTDAADQTFAIPAADEDGARFLAAAHRLEINRRHRRPAR